MSVDKRVLTRFESEFSFEFHLAPGHFCNPPVSVDSGRRKVVHAKISPRARVAKVITPE